MFRLAETFYRHRVRNPRDLVAESVRRTIGISGAATIGPRSRATRRRPPLDAERSAASWLETFSLFLVLLY